jgi:hypothetical protein
MRRSVIALAFLLTLSLAAAAGAEEEDEEPGVFTEFGIEVKNHFLGGLNGVITFPADPVMMTVDPPETLRELPGGKVTGPFLGFFAGMLQGVYRVTMGALDMALAPTLGLAFVPYRIVERVLLRSDMDSLSMYPQLSPLWRYKLIPGWEHEDE